MDKLRDLIGKKRKEVESLCDPEKKYFKRELLLKKEEEEYRQRSAARAQSAEKELLENQRLKTSNPLILDVSESEIPPRHEVIRRLRERRDPITLFGESHAEAYARLKQLELVEPDKNRGFRNDFQEAMEKVDQEYLNELMKSTNRNKDRANDVKVEDVNTTIEEIKKLAANLGRKREDAANDCATIVKFLNFLLELWGKELNARDERLKISTQGKIESANYTQTQSYLKPLFKQLDNAQVADDILKHLMLITRHLLDRDYIKANDAYLQMAIGNSPWPIGVTMVGIHARTGREKIFSQNIAHVLNDETQRKYIQGLKRLITRCQKLFPTDPSRCVEYNA